MNLHGIVRGAITSVNPDVVANYLASTGSTTDAAGNQTPAYAAATPVRIQVQPTNGRDIERLNALNIQGVPRTIFMFGNTQGIVRVFAQGGDLLQFVPFLGQPIQTWLVVVVDGPWNVEGGGWTKLLCVLQTDSAP